MIYEKCRECEFWVIKQKNTNCPNCGIIDPYISKPQVKELNTFEGCTFLFGILVGFCGGIYYGWHYYGFGISLFCGFAGTIICSLIALIIIFITSERRESFYQRLSHSFLKKDEELIRTRLEEIKEQHKNLLKTLKQINRINKNVENTQLEKTLEILRETATQLPAHRNQYRIRLWAIELVRWQNALEPLRINIESISIKECISRLESLEKLREQGKIILASWQQKKELASLNDGQLVIEQLQEVLNACEKLHEILVTQQAVLAVKDVTGLDPHLQQHVSINTLDLFNTNLDVTQSASILMDLEYQHARLQAENEVIKQMQKFITNT